MGINRTIEKVRFGNLSDLPENIQTKVFGVNKLIADEVNEKIDEEHYEDLTKSRWAMSCLDDFKTAPSVNGEVGSVKVYKNGKQYKCIIQVTGHFRSVQYGWIEELLDTIIKDVYQDVRPAVRKKYDVTLVSEGSMGNPDEGFVIYLSSKDAKMIWEKFEGRKTKTIKESTEFTEFNLFSKKFVDHVVCNTSKLPNQLSHLISETKTSLYEACKNITDSEYNTIANGVNLYREILDDNIFGVESETEITRNNSDYTGSTLLTDVEISNNINALTGDQLDSNKISNYMRDVLKRSYDTVKPGFDSSNPGKTLEYDDQDGYPFIYIQYSSSYAYALLNYINNPNKYPMGESFGNENLGSNHAGLFDPFRKKNTPDITATKSSPIVKRSYVPITEEEVDKLKQTLYKLIADINKELTPIFNQYPIYGLHAGILQEEDVENGRAFSIYNGNNLINAIELTNGKPDLRLSILISGLDQYDFMKRMEDEHPDEVNRLSNTYDINTRGGWTDIHWTEKILGYDKTLDEIMALITGIINAKFQMILNFSSGGDNDSGPEYIGDIDSDFICNGIDLSDIHYTESVLISDDLINYYENYRGKMSYDDYFYETSKAPLKNSFRYCVNVKNGHIIQITFDLDPKSVVQIGDHSRQSGRDYAKDRETARNIRKTGNTDFSSYGTVLGITDQDTGERLKSVTTIGVVGDGGTRFQVPEKHRDARLRDESGQFGAYPVDMRERIAKEANINPPDAITFTVGKREKIPSYKSTRTVKSLSTLYRNQWRSGRGINRKSNDKFIANSELERSKMSGVHIRNAVKKLEDEYNKLKPMIKGNEDIEELAEYFERNLKRIHAIIDSQKNEKFGQTIEDSRYSDRYKALDNTLAEIKDSIRTVEKKTSASLKESASNTPEYNVDMTEAQAKATLRTLSQDIINKSKDKNYKISQYTANIYANIITKNLLPKWSSGYKKLSIALDSYQSFYTFEFKIPTMSQDFISRFINGREPINAFLHRVPEIKIKMSPRIFHTMQNPDDAFNFFRAAVKYYDSKAEKYAKQLMHEAMKLNHSIKHLVSTTKLSGIVTIPMQLLFVFDDVHMNNAKTFILTDEDMKAVNNFMKNIYTKYASPEKEKTKIIEDVKILVRDLRESCDPSDNMKDLYYLPEAVEKYLTGGYDSEISKANDLFESDQVDNYAMTHPGDSEIRYIREKFGVKKLKRIPTDLVAYISIETEAIESANDKMMIASYCLSKIEIVEWYIELLEVGSKKYVVPHSLPYLQNVRTQLLACYKKIMDTKVSSNRNRPIIDIEWPSGYEG